MSMKFVNEVIHWPARLRGLHVPLVLWIVSWKWCFINFFAYSSLTQVIIDHDYLGPLCLQFTSPPSVADVKNEIMDRTALPIEEQTIYCNGKKVVLSLDMKVFGCICKWSFV